MAIGSTTVGGFRPVCLTDSSGVALNVGASAGATKGTPQYMALVDDNGFVLDTNGNATTTQVSTWEYGISVDTAGQALAIGGLPGRTGFGGYRFVTIVGADGTATNVGATPSTTKVSTFGYIHLVDSNGVNVASSLAPVNRAVPSIIGSTTDGTAWTFNLGTWTGTITGFDMQLETTDATPVVLISRTTATNSVTGSVTSAQVLGKSVKLKVWAKNGSVETLATSATFGPITAATDQLVLALAMVNGTEQGLNTYYGYNWITALGANTKAAVPKVAGVTLQDNSSVDYTTCLYPIRNPNTGFTAQSWGWNGTGTTSDATNSDLIDPNNFTGLIIGKGRMPSNLAIDKANLRIDCPAGTYKIYSAAGASGTTVSCGWLAYDGAATAPNLIAGQPAPTTQGSGTQVVDASGTSLTVAAYEAIDSKKMGNPRTITTTGSFFSIAKHTTQTYLNALSIWAAAPSAGPVTYTVEGAPEQLMFTTSAALLSGITAAKPGQVLTLTTVVSGFTITLASSKRAPGICIVLPATQPYKLRGTGITGLNTEIIGGNCAADIVNGNSSDATANQRSVDMTGCSFFALRGLKFGDAGVACVTDACTDFEITDFVTEWNRDDVFKMRAPQRFLINNGTSYDQLRGQRFLFTTDNSVSPQYGVAVSNSGVNRTVDTYHGDWWQSYANATSGGPAADYPADGQISNNTIEMLGQGIGTLGYPATGGQQWKRVKVLNNDVAGQDINIMAFEGDDLWIEGNTLRPHPFSPGAIPAFSTSYTTPTVTIQRQAPIPANAKIWAGNNVVITSAGITPVFAALSGVNFTSTTLNGDAGTAGPNLPNLIRLPWAPVPVKPSISRYTGAPIIINPKIQFDVTANAGNDGAGINTGTPTTGTWLACNFGQVKGYAGCTFAYQWQKNGVNIGGATTSMYQVVAGDIGASITCIVTPTNAFGTGTGVATAAVVPA